MLASALREEWGGVGGAGTLPHLTLVFSIGFTVGCAELNWCALPCLGSSESHVGQPEKNLMGFRGGLGGSSEITVR